MPNEAAPLSLEEAKTKLGFISMSDMAKEINIERIIMDDYDSVERDLCIFLVQGYYNQILAENGGSLNKPGRQKAFFYAKYHATRRLSSENGGLSGLIQRSKMYMLNDAQQTGWHHALEYENVAELLASILEEKEGSDEAYDWKFIVEQLVPAAEKAGIPAGMMESASLNVKKIRGIVPAARELLERQKNNKIDPEEAEKTLHSWIKKTVDPNVTYTGLREELNKWRGLSVNRRDPIEGYKIMMPDGKFAIVIHTKDDREVSMVEQALTNRVDIKLTGFDYMQNLVMGQMKETRLKEMVQQ